MSLAWVYLEGVTWPQTPEDVPEPSHCRVFCVKFHSVYVVKGVWSILPQGVCRLFEIEHIHIIHEKMKSIIHFHLYLTIMSEGRNSIRVVSVGWNATDLCVWDEQKHFMKMYFRFGQWHFVIGVLSRDQWARVWNNQEKQQNISYIPLSHIVCLWTCTLVAFVVLDCCG